MVLLQYEFRSNSKITVLDRMDEWFAVSVGQIHWMCACGHNFILSLTLIVGRVIVKDKKCWHLIRSYRGMAQFVLILCNKILFKIITYVTCNLPLSIFCINIFFRSHFYMVLILVLFMNTGPCNSKSHTNSNTDPDRTYHS